MYILSHYWQIGPLHHIDLRELSLLKIWRYFSIITKVGVEVSYEQATFLSDLQQLSLYFIFTT